MIHEVEKGGKEGDELLNGGWLVTWLVVQPSESICGS